MWLPWDYALYLAAALGVVAWFGRKAYPRAASWAGEVTIVAVLYALWQYAGRISVLGIDDAVARGEWLWRFERAIFLPNELTLQNALVPHSFWTQAANLYYAGAHVPAMGIFLVWLFARHRSEYPAWRNALALTTFACLLIQLIPLAPPRLTDETGMIDTGLAYGQSVYGVLGRGIAGQLQAMPSIHVAWAAVIGWAALVVTDSRWRWIGLIHFVLTMVVVAVTGNHYWMDGIIAIALLVIGRWVGQRLVEFGQKRTHLTPGAPTTPGSPGGPEPVEVTV